MNTARSTVLVSLENQQMTEQLGGHICAIAVTGDVIALYGQLGAGKSTLARGFLARLGLKGSAASPTFNIAHVYDSDPPVYHVDAYRFKQQYEFEDTGYAEELGASCIFIVEWAERMQSYLPDERIDIVLEHTEHGRVATIEILTPDHDARHAALCGLLRQAKISFTAPSD